MDREESKSFEVERTRVLESCNSCGACVPSCAFLETYGTPAELADTMAPGDPDALGLSFSCSLCGLCTALCPAGADPARMLGAARSAALAAGYALASGHRHWISFEDRGTSERYRLLAIPKGGRTVFFPGCSLPGKKPETVKMLYEFLSQAIPGLGVALSCCSRPSRDLGLDNRFRQDLSGLCRELSSRGVTEVVTACPGCFQVFAESGEIAVRSAYEVMVERGWKGERPLSGAVAIHDPCVARSFPVLHEAVRELVSRSGLGVSEMENHGRKTLCCGEGGCVSAVSPELSLSLAERRKTQTRGLPVVTYCSGCISNLGGAEKALHILDLVFSPERALSGMIPLARPPVTYINRLLLKRFFRRAVDRS
ncbi:MAG: (Fe-S)-binding protein [Thermodesulfobacteriota bacterium]